MGPGTMSWWYWFGMQIFGITSIVLTWWLFLDASRRKGAPSRFVWPVVAFAGLLMQAPAFAIAPSVQTDAQGTTAALVGIFGLLVVALASITHFYRSPSSGGSAWGLRTRDENSASRSNSDRRHSRAPQASVPVGSAESRRSGRVAPPSIPGLRPEVAPASAPAPVAVHANPPASVVAPSPIAPPVAAANTSALNDDTTVVEDDATIVGDAPAATIMDEPAAMVAEVPSIPAPVSDSDAARTVCDDVAHTIVDEPGTVTDEPNETLLEESDANAPRLMITDGRSSQIIITDRSGPFIVGRDPSKCSLAVDDSRASRAHFSITQRDGHFYVQDLGSSNGTFVNGALVQEALSLNDGDTVEFGRTVATFEMAM